MAFGNLVQSNGGTIAGVSSFNATLPGAITAGNLVVVMVSANNVPSGANTGWIKSTGMSPVNNAQGLLWWFIGAGGDTIPTVTFASATTCAWKIAEYEGPFDASPYLTSTGTAINGAFSSVTSPAITPTAGSDCLVIAGLGGQSGSDGSWNVASVTLGSFTNSYVNASQQFRQAGTEAHVACQVSRVIASASGSYSTTGTFSAVSTSGGSCRLEMGIAFKQGAGGSVPLPARQYAIGSSFGAGLVVDPDRDFALRDAFAIASVAPPPPTSRIKVWLSGAWVQKLAKVWMGSSWVEKPIKIWSGSAWV